MRLFSIPALLVGVGALAPAAEPPPANDDVYQVGKQLFDQFAPPEVKQQYEFPSKQEFDEFMVRLDRALDSGSMKDLAAYEPQARAALAALQAMPDEADLAGWLSNRLDELDEARRVVEETGAGAAPPGRAPAPAGGPEVARPPQVPAAPPPGIPYYGRWLARERGRPAPANAAELMPRLRRAFTAEDVAPEVAWIAEAESSLNPSALSPSGARGLFQLKADTARDLGLSTFLPDERTDPDKSARAAARLLKRLREEFGSWPLAFAAYNAGEGRLRRLLAARHAQDYAGVADGLPGGTQMYVPKVCALIFVRSGMSPDRLPATR